MLTKNAKQILYVIYKEYQNRRKHGVSRSESALFSSAEVLQSDFFPDIPLEDVEDSLCELGQNGYLHNYSSDNTIALFILQNDAIAELENRNAEIFFSIADFVSKFI